MFSGLFQSTTIPVLAEVVSFTQARHMVLAGNIANADTPGYQVRDLSVEDFQQRLKTAIDARKQPAATSPGEPAAAKPVVAEVARATPLVLRHDQSNLDMETQVSEMTKNQMQYNVALTIMTDQFKMLQSAISEKV